MNNLITINQNDNGIETVNARDLHAFLESKQEFSNWIKARIEQYSFVENQDFTIDKIVIRNNAQKNYHITLDMAKELSMVERNDKGKQARIYFIECERRAKAKQAPAIDLNNPKQLLTLLADYATNLNKANEQIEVMTPKVEAFDRISKEEGVLGVREAAKSLCSSGLDIRQTDLIVWLLFNKWAYRSITEQDKEGRLCAYADKIAAGLAVEQLIKCSDGKMRSSFKLTMKGFMELAKIFSQPTARKFDSHQLDFDLNQASLPKGGRLH